MENELPVIWLTGLSGAGKTTLGAALRDFLVEQGYGVTFLDGDQVRQHKRNLGFSEEDRKAQAKAVALMAAGAQLQGDFVVVCLISPFASSRQLARDICDDFIEVFVDAPLEVCEKRDPKGLYKKVRQGLIKNFTGIDQVYEKPKKAELVVDTVANSFEKSLDLIINSLKEKGYVRSRQAA